MIIFLILINLVNTCCSRGKHHVVRVFVGESLDDIHLLQEELNSVFKLGVAADVRCPKLAKLMNKSTSEVF